MNLANAAKTKARYGGERGRKATFWVLFACLVVALTAPAAAQPSAGEPDAGRRRASRDAGAEASSHKEGGAGAAAEATPQAPAAKGSLRPAMGSPSPALDGPETAEEPTAPAARTEAAPAGERAPAALPTRGSGPPPREGAGPASPARATSPPDAAALDALPAATPFSVPSAPILLHETPVFTLRGADAAELQRRSIAIGHALEEAAIDGRPDDVRVEQRDDVAVVFVGDIPIVQLTHADARYAGDSSLGLHAARISARIKEAIRKEQQRSAIAHGVFSISLVVFFGLVAIFLMRKLNQLSSRSRDYLLNDAGALAMSLRLKSVDLIGPATMRSGLLVGLSVGRWLGLLGILYAWLLVSLSLFQATRGYTERLTGVVLRPVSELFSRVATSLPLLAVALLGVLAVALLIRFVGLFFASVERGQTRLGWLPYDLTTPTSFLLRASIILAALMFGAPVITGNAEGIFTRAGLLMLGAVGLAATPLLASVVIGVMVVFWRRVRVGDYVEMGGRFGKVLGIDLLAVRMQDAEGAILSVPHLLTLFHATRTVGRLAHATAHIRVVGSDRARELVGLLAVALAKQFENPEVDVVAFSPEYLELRVRVTSGLANVNVELYSIISATLASSNFQLVSGTLARS